MSEQVKLDINKIMIAIMSLKESHPRCLICDDENPPHMGIYLPRASSPYYELFRKACGGGVPAVAYALCESCINIEDKERMEQLDAALVKPLLN